MKSFMQWIATGLVIGVFLTLSLYGMAMPSFMVHAGTTVDTMRCTDSGCSSSSVPCLTECVQQLDHVRQGLIVEMVAVAAVGMLSVLFFDRFCANIITAYFWAPPWRSHRLFALRE